MTDYTITLPQTRPLSLNDRGHWRGRAAKIAEFRTATRVLARAVPIPALGRFTVELHYAPRDRRRRDRENLVATLKPCVDGLIDAGVAEDDDDRFYEPTMPIIDAPTGERTGRLYLIVRGIS